MAPTTFINSPIWSHCWRLAQLSAWLAVASTTGTSLVERTLSLTEICGSNHCVNYIIRKTVKYNCIFLRKEEKKKGHLLKSTWCQSSILRRLPISLLWLLVPLTNKYIWFLPIELKTFLLNQLFTLQLNVQNDIRKIRWYTTWQ